MQAVVFALLAVATLGGALMVVLSYNLLRSALGLVLALFGIAGLFLLLEAEFVAIVQVLVYVGAIATLVIFAVMLCRNYFDPHQERFNDQWRLVAGFAALFFVALAAVVLQVAWPVAIEPVPADVIAQLGAAFVGPYAVPFEIASALLVVAMIGAIIVARERE